MKEITVDSDIVIREIRAGDEDRINGFFDSMGGEVRSLFNRHDHNRQGVLKQLTRPLSSRKYWLALSGGEEGEMLGYVFLLDTDTGIPTMGIALSDECRGRGLGKQLTAFVIAEAKKMGKGGIQVTTHTANIRAQALYEAMGFRLMGISARNVQELYYLLAFRSE